MGERTQAQQKIPAAIDAFTRAGEALGRVLSTVTAAVGSPHLVIFGPPQLTQESDLESAAAFLTGVRRRHGYPILGINVRIDPRVLEHDTLPTAAAATAVYHFISEPLRWMPTIANPVVGTMRPPDLVIPSDRRQGSVARPL